MKSITFVLFLGLVAQSAKALIGGKPAKQWDPQSAFSTRGELDLSKEIFPSIVLLSMGCTGTVVGPRHILTAAHCVIDSRGERALLPDYEPGKMLRFDTKIKFELAENYEDSYSHQATIERVLIHSSFLFQSSNNNFPENTGDLAIIILKKLVGTNEITLNNLTSGLIPISRLSLDTIEENAEVVKLGFGCESIGSDAVESSSHWRLKYAQVKLPNQNEALRKAATYEKIQFKDVFDKFYWITKGYFFDDSLPGEPTLCPGDSGGPLYSGKKVIGVNSRSRLGNFRVGFAGVAIDFHTRLDHQTPLRIDRWITLALTEPIKRWYQGVSYFSIVPRAKDFTYEVIATTRPNLLTHSNTWLLFADGINGTCPLKFGAIQAISDDGKEETLKHVIHSTQTARVETRNKTKISPVSFKVKFEQDKNVRTDSTAGICYVSILALE